MISIKNIVFGIAILVVTIIVAVSGINTLYKQPRYEDFCNQSRINMNYYINTSADCIAADGVWNPNYGPKTVPSENGYCDLTFKCNEQFNNASEEFSKKVFYVAIPIGIIVIVIGALLFGLEFVGAGLMLGGVGTIIYGVGGYWRYTENWLRFAISLVGLIALICVSYYFNMKMHNKDKKFF